MTEATWELAINWLGALGLIGVVAWGLVMFLRALARIAEASNKK